MLKNNSSLKVLVNNFFSKAFFKSKTASLTEYFVSNPKIFLIFSELT